MTTYRARAAVEAWLLLAVIHLDLTVSAREAGRTLARIAALARIRACRVVLARLVVRAVVEICRKEEAGVR